MKEIKVLVPDKEYAFFMNLIQHLSFLKIKDAAKPEKKKNTKEAFKEKLRKDLEQAFAEVELAQQGKIKLKTAEELFNEL